MLSASRVDDISPKINISDASSLAEDINSNEKYHYFFVKRKNHLACVIQTIDGEDLGMTFVHSALDTMHVLTVGAECKTKWIYDKKKMTFCMENIQHHASFEVLMSFIKRLKALGVRELHENRQALWFYTTSGGDQILNSQNYPPSIIEFLKNEYDAIDQLIKSSPQQYNMLIEVGCGDLVNLQLAKQNKIKYLGIEVSPAAVRAARERINRNRPQFKDVNIVCIDVLDVKKSSLNLTAEDVPLVLLPFNLFGNLAPISLLLARFRKLGKDLAISLYKTDDSTCEMRKAYYSNCGYKNIKEEKHEIGIYFRSAEGLYTVAYDHGYLLNLLTAFGFDVTITDAGKYGVIMHAHPQPFLELAPQAAAAPIIRPTVNVSHTAEPFSFSLYLSLIMSIAGIWSVIRVVSSIVNEESLGATELACFAIGSAYAVERFGLFKHCATAAHYQPAADNIQPRNQ